MSIFKHVSSADGASASVQFFFDFPVAPVNPYDFQERLPARPVGGKRLSSQGDVTTKTNHARGKRELLKVLAEKYG